VNDWSRCPACGTKVQSSDTACPTCEAALSAAATQPGDDSPGTSSLFKKDKIAAELKDALAPGIQVLRRFGAGAMSTLYLGRDPALRRLVAIKVLSKDLAKDSVARARFTREAESAAAVSHPHVVGIYQVGKLPQSNVPYIVMQFVDGKTLQQELLSDRIMPEARAKRIVGEVASALATAHERGLVHRDIKPANILMDREGGRAVVLDFGITAALDRTSLAGSEKLTIQGMAVGTPIYMSPEQAAAKEVTDRSDVYSLGAVAFELVTGRPPFSAESPEGYIAAHVGEQPPDLGELRQDLDPQFANLINQCLAKDPAKRPTAAEASRALLSSTHPPVEWPPPGLEQIRGRGWGALVSLGAAAAMGLFFFAMLLFGPNPGSGGGTGETAPVWFFFLRTALTATVLVGLATLVLAGRLAVLLKGARAAGYPWPVTVQVALDPRHDTAALFNGYGVFALLGDANREWLLRFRRYRGWALGVTVALAIFCPLLWSAMLHSGTAGGRSGLVTGWDAVVLFLPAGLGLLVTVALGIPETVVRSRARKWPRFIWQLRRPIQIREELVGSWLDSAELTAAPEEDERLEWGIAAAPAVAAMLFGLLLLFVLGNTLNAARTAARWRDAANGAAAGLVDDSLPPGSWQQLRTLVGASSAIRVRHPTAGAEIAAGLHLADSAAASIEPPSALAEWVAGDRLPWWQLVPDGIPDAVSAALAADSVQRLLAVWRRLAASRMGAALWMYEDQLRGITDSTPNLPLLTYKGTMALARLNELDGLVATVQERNGAALFRARENLAVGRRLLNDPLNGWLAPEVIAVGASMMTDIGTLTGDRDVLLEATQLTAALPTVGSRSFASGGLVAPFLMASAIDPAGLTSVGDTTQAPYARWALIEGIARGYCGNAREVLFGVASDRLETLALSDSLAADIPHTDEWVASAGQRLQEWIDSPGGRTISREVRRTGFLRVMGWFGFRGFSNRIEFCRAETRRFAG
jgi:hypothetical protein